MKKVLYFFSRYLLRFERSYCQVKFRDNSFRIKIPRPPKPARSNIRQIQPYFFMLSVKRVFAGKIYPMRKNTINSKKSAQVCSPQKTLLKAVRMRIRGIRWADSLSDVLTQEKNQLGTAHESVIPLIKEHLEYECRVKGKIAPRYCPHFTPKIADFGLK